MKRFISLFMCLVLMLFYVVPVFATDSTFASQRDILLEEKAEAAISSTRYGIRTIKQVVSLYNLSGDLEAYCYSAEPSGYVIISYKTGSVLEFSPVGKCPVPLDLSTRVYYNGVLQYYTKNLQYYVHTVSGNQIPIANMVEVLNDDFQQNFGGITADSRGTTYECYLAAPSTAIGAFSNSSSTWYCGITAATILIDWYHRNWSGSYYPSMVTSISGLRNYLKNYSYIDNRGITLYEMRDGTATATGLASYFALNGITTRTINISSNNYSYAYSQIATYGRPVVMIMPTVLVRGEVSNHYVIVYGLDDLGSEQYYVINDVYGRNEVWILVNDVTVGTSRMMYLS